MQMYKKYIMKDFGDVVTGNTPSTTKSDYWNGDIPFYSPADFTENVYCTSTEKTITELGLIQGRAIPINSVMVTCIASIGKMAINDKIGITNQQINTIITYEQFDYKYLYYLINQNIYKLANTAPQTAVPIINKTEFEKTSIIGLVDKTQQQKIADILSTCDEVIEKTEETIEKYRQIKAGMMQDLFTRGLDENGKLRPTYPQAPDLYKYSKVLDRYIPKDWDVKPLEEYTTLIKDGTHGTHKDIPNGIPLLSAKDIQDGEIIIPNDCRTISQLDYNSIHKSYNIDVNDVLLTIVGTIGRVAIVKNIEKLFTFQRSVAIIKLVNPNFASYFYYYLLYENTQKQLLTMMNASAQGGVYLGQLANVIITMPKDEDEINNIFNYLNQMDSKIKLEEQYLNKYKQIKQGLMKRLLTPPADAEIVEE